jgi:hypothetical protein
MRVIHIHSGRLGFKTRLLIALAIVTTLSLLALLALAVLGILLFIVPIILVAGLMYALLPGKRTSHAPATSNENDILEGRYRVIDRMKDHD